VEEASFLSSNGNDVVNSKLLANFSKHSERLRAPDGSVSTVDVQLLRVWLRRKYINCDWQNRENDTKTDTNMSSPIKASGKYQTRATKAKIPSKRNKPAPATADLLGDIFTESVPAAPATPVDDGWNAFGGSTSNTIVQAPFETNTGQGNQVTQSQQSSFPENATNSSPPNFQPTFDQANFNQTSQPIQQQQPQTSVPASQQNNLGMASGYQQHQAQTAPSQFSDPSLPQQGNQVLTMNGNDSATFQTQNPMSPTGDSNAQNTFDAFSGLDLAPSQIVDTHTDVHKENIDEVKPDAEVKKIASEYHVGQKVVYRDSHNKMSTVEIISIHHDDTLVPFYSIRMPDSREKQTDDKHLSLSENVNREQSNLESIQGSVTSFEPNLHMNNDSREQSSSKVDEVVAMVHTLNEGQLALVEQFIRGMR